MQGVRRYEAETKTFSKYAYFTRMKYGPVYILGAAVGNSSKTKASDIIKLYASVDEEIAAKENTSCCLKYDGSSGPVYHRQPVIAKNDLKRPTKLSPFHYSCLNAKPGIIPNGVALTFSPFTCGEEHVVYRKPFVSVSEPGNKLAICTKAAYGSISAEMIIEWMETYKYLGVDKVITYFLKDLNHNARKVLEYYASTGILDLYYFEPAAAGMRQV